MAAWLFVIVSITLSKLVVSQNPPNANIGAIQYLGPPLRFPADPNTNTPIPPNPNGGEVTFTNHPSVSTQTPRLISGGGTMSLCPRGENIFNCFVDPCRFATCPGIQGAKCESNYCGGCNAIWKDPFTLKQLTQSECHPSTPYPIEIDPIPPMAPPSGMPPFRPFPYPIPPQLPPSPQPPRPCLMVYCFARPCSVSSCTSYPEATCADDYCGGCNAIFTDVDTGKELTTAQCNGEPADTTSPPPIVIKPRPVCTADMKQCSDGSFVGRDSSNNCQFKSCPISINPSPVTTSCPSDTPQWPRPGSSCSFTGTCSYGQETCCGITHYSYKCNCESGTTQCFYTDACMASHIMGCDPNPLPQPEPIPYPRPPMPCTADAKMCPDGSYVSRDYNNGCEWEPCSFPIPVIKPLPNQPNGCELIRCRPGYDCCDNGMGGATCCQLHTLMPIPPRINPCAFTTILCPANQQCCDNGNGVATCCPVDPVPDPGLPTLPPACAVISCIYGTYCCPDGNGGARCCSRNGPTDPISIPLPPISPPQPEPKPLPVGVPEPPLPAGCLRIFCPRNTHCCDNGNGRASCCLNDVTIDPVPLPQPKPLPPTDPVRVPIDPPPIAILCTADVKTCPDGSYVHRDSNNNCEFKACPIATVPVSARPTILPKPIFCTMDVYECLDGSFVSRDPVNNCEFRPCPQPQLSVSGASARAAPGIMNAICGNVGDKCSIGYSLSDRCCDSGHHGKMKCSLDDIDQNGNQIGKCCIKPKQSGCNTDTDCCYNDGICHLSSTDGVGICKRDRDTLKIEAAQKVENNFDNFEMIRDTKGTKYMAISEATIIVIMIIILGLFPVLYYVYYKKYIVQKIQQQARREVFHGLEIQHSEKSEFNDTSSDEDNAQNQQYVD